MATADSLGEAFTAMGNCREAEKVLGRDLVLKKKMLSTEYEDTLISMRSSTSALREQARYDDAGCMPKEEIILSEKNFGKSDGRFLVSPNNLVKIIICQERLIEAESMLKVAVKET